jgi:glycosyltransferase involved in cell wall biosynthesis
MSIKDIIERYVSICVQTYQNAGTIEKCIQGIITQDFDQAYEILLGEDASSDGTRDICKNLAKKYPDKIRLFLHDRENNITVDGRPSGRFNFLYNVFKARGEYIAICEGDDYWVDVSKLRKQVQMFSEEPETGLIHTDNIDLDLRNGKKTILNKGPVIEKGSEFRQLLIRNFITTVTVLIKRDLLLDAISYIYKLRGVEMVMDYSIWLYAASRSKIKHLPLVSAVYCLSGDTTSRPEKIKEQYAYIKKIFDIRMFYCKELNIEEKITNTIELNYYRKLLFYAFKNRDKTMAFSALMQIKQLNVKPGIKDLMKYWGSKNELAFNLMKLIIKV